MATTLRDFIAQRETEIRDQQKALKAELRELQIAKSALDAQPVAVSNAAPPSLTIKEMAREILSAQPNGLNSSGVLDGIKKTFGREIERTSLSPQLSRMKDDGELVLAGEVWFTAEHYEVLRKREWAELDEMLRSDTKEQQPPSASKMEHFDSDLDSEIPF